MATPIITSELHENEFDGLNTITVDHINDIYQTQQ